MSSSSSSGASSLPYDPIRPNHVEEAPNTSPIPNRFHAGGPVMSEFSGTTLHGLIRNDESTEQARRQAMMAQMNWSAHPTVSSTHSQADGQILMHNAIAWARNYPLNHIEDFLPYLGNDAYGHDIDPLDDQENLPPVYPANYTLGHFDDNFPIAANNDVYDNHIGPVAPIAPMYENENDILPDYPSHYPYGHVIIPHQIAPLQQSLLNSAPASPPQIEEEIPHPHEIMQYWPAESNYPDPEPDYHNEMEQVERIWEDGDEEEFLRAASQELREIEMESVEDGNDEWLHVARQESPEIKMELVEDEDYLYSIPAFPGSYHAHQPQETGILESIETDDVEEYQHIKCEEVEDSYSSAPSTINTCDSINSSGSSMTSYDVIERYF